LTATVQLAGGSPPASVWNWIVVEDVVLADEAVSNARPIHADELERTFRAGRVHDPS
jgi:hypothetical protein